MDPFRIELSIVSIKGSWTGSSLGNLSGERGAVCRGPLFKRVERSDPRISRVDIGKFQFFKHSFIVHVSRCGDVEEALGRVESFMETLGITWIGDVYNISAKFFLRGPPVNPRGLKSYLEPHESIGSFHPYGTCHLRGGVNLNKDGVSGKITKSRTIGDIYKSIKICLEL